MRAIFSGAVCCLFISLALLTAGCTGSEEPETGEVTFEGTVTYVDLEGGFWGITGDDGGHFHPTNLPEDYQVDGLHVRVTATPEDGGVGIQMWGKRITITEIARA